MEDSKTAGREWDADTTTNVDEISHLPMAEFVALDRARAKGTMRYLVRRAGTDLYSSCSVPAYWGPIEHAKMFLTIEAARAHVVKYRATVSIDPSVYDNAEIAVCDLREISKEKI